MHAYVYIYIYIHCAMHGVYCMRQITAGKTLYSVELYLYVVKIRVHLCDKYSSIIRPCHRFFRYFTEHTLVVCHVINYRMW
jgi:hypothetical protein